MEPTPRAFANLLNKHSVPATAEELVHVHQEAAGDRCCAPVMTFVADPCKLYSVVHMSGHCLLESDARWYVITKEMTKKPSEVAKHSVRFHFTNRDRLRDGEINYTISLNDNRTIDVAGEQPRSQRPKYMLDGLGGGTIDVRCKFANYLTTFSLSRRLEKRIRAIAFILKISDGTTTQTLASKPCLLMSKESIAREGKQDPLLILSTMAAVSSERTVGSARAEDEEAPKDDYDTEDEAAAGGGRTSSSPSSSERTSSPITTIEGAPRSFAWLMGSSPRWEFSAPIEKGVPEFTLTKTLCEDD